jgi:hypothetical protein
VKRKAVKVSLREYAIATKRQSIPDLPLAAGVYGISTTNRPQSLNIVKSRALLKSLVVEFIVMNRQYRDYYTAPSRGEGVAPAPLAVLDGRDRP